MRIHEVGRPKGANKPPTRFGRGVGSGHGKTAGRGNKGAKSRTGPGLRIGFEGGQMPLIRRIPKRGFTNAARATYQILNVGNLSHFKNDASVDKEALAKAGLIKKINSPVKILGDGAISKPLTVIADAFSESAKKKIQDAGGKVEILRK